MAQPTFKDFQTLVERVRVLENRLDDVTEKLRAHEESTSAARSLNERVERIEREMFGPFGASLS
ncbi:hypothetical protein NWF34_10125 [Gordonia sp. GONU]|uniref:hypothetical protein n=1 Tax=Gordonia sp. GONU TaxID=2972949 RepID=UPI0021ACB642|nr:hypothetical protein [Gordonia sp. GONU]MCR8897305.1 hypothetical protein [Gordonia sp. GONU]